MDNLEDFFKEGDKRCCHRCEDREAGCWCDDCCCSICRVYSKNYYEDSDAEGYCMYSVWWREENEQEYNQFVSLSFEIKIRTEKAVLAVFPNKKEIWIPRSHIKGESQSIRKWFLKKTNNLKLLSFPCRKTIQKRLL